jgi:hypothetical protein
MRSKSLLIVVVMLLGDADAMAPIGGVRKLEETAKKAGKSRMEFHYFENLDHSLNIIEYFVKGTFPESLCTSQQRAEQRACYRPL